MREIRLLLPVVVLATASGCNEILGMDAGEPFPETSSGGTGGSSSASSSSTGGGGEGGAGTGGAGGVMCDPDTGIGCGVHVWSKIFGDASYQSPAGIASDAQGNVYVAGGFHGTIQLGGIPLISAGASDVFLAKFDPAGNHVWSKRFGDTQSQDPNDIAVDADGNVAITGNFAGAVDFGAGVIQGGDSGAHDMFVAKFDTNGNLFWSGGYGDPTVIQSGHGVAIDGSGAVVVVGGFRGTLGPLTALEPEGYGDSFLIKFSSLDGTIVWANQFGDAGSQFNAARAIAIDTSDSIVMVGGPWTGTLDFGGAELTELDGDIFLVRFDTNGNHVWSKSFNASVYGSASDVAVDSLGNLVVTGRFQGAVDLGDGPLASAGDFDAYLAKYSVVGEPLWSYRYGSVGNDSGSSVVVDATGDIALVGVMAGEVDLGGDDLPFAGDSDVFLAKLSAEGSHRWSRGFGDANSQRSVFVAAAGSEVLLVCATEGTLNFGSTPLTSAGNVDVAVAKFTP